MVCDAEIEKKKRGTKFGERASDATPVVHDMLESWHACHPKYVTFNAKRTGAWALSRHWSGFSFLD